MNIPNPIIDRATKTALSSDVRRSKMAALIVNKNGHILNAAPNMRLDGHSNQFTIHAEAFVIAKCIKQGVFSREKINDLIMYVFRYHPHKKEFSLAKPCLTCQKIIQEIGINTYYTINNKIQKLY